MAVRTSRLHQSPRPSLESVNIPMQYATEGDMKPYRACKARIQAELHPYSPPTCTPCVGHMGLKTTLSDVSSCSLSLRENCEIL